MNSKVGFWLRRTAAVFEPASIAQLIQVVLLPRRQSLAQIQGVSLPNSQLLNSFRYMLRKLFPLFTLVLVIVLFDLTSKFCEKKTDGVSIAFIHTDLEYDAAWETTPLSKEARAELETVFAQKFRYLAC